MQIARPAAADSTVDFVRAPSLPKHATEDVASVMPSPMTLLRSPFSPASPLPVPVPLRLPLLRLLLPPTPRVLERLRQVDRMAMSAQEASSSLGLARATPIAPRAVADSTRGNAPEPLLRRNAMEDAALATPNPMTTPRRFSAVANPPLQRGPPPQQIHPPRPRLPLPPLGPHRGLGPVDRAERSTHPSRDPKTLARPTDLNSSRASASATQTVRLGAAASTPGNVLVPSSRRRVTADAGLATRSPMTRLPKPWREVRRRRESLYESTWLD